MERKHFSIGNAIKWGFKAFFDQIVFFLVAALLYIGIYVIVSIAATASIRMLAQRMAEDNPLLLVLLGLLILFLVILGMWLLVGLMKVMLDIYDHGKAEFKTLFSQGRLVIPFMGASILFSLLVCLGLSFLVIPGVYFMCRYFFFNYALIDKDLGIIESFHESSRLTEGARWHIFGFAIISWFINLLPIFWFATMLAMAYAYRQQQENSLKLPIATQ